MTTSTQTSGAALLACVDEAIKLSSFLMDRWSSKLGVALYDRSLVVADSAERHQIQDAVASLAKHRSIMEKEFSDGVKRAVVQDMSPAAASGKLARSGRSLSSVSFDELELMGDTQVQQAVEIASMHQIIKLACESGLASFSARISTAQGFLVIRGDSNPMRPEVMAQVLNDLLLSLPISAQTRSCWLLDGARIMGVELQSLYLALNDFLAGLGIAPAAYGVLGTLPARHAGAASRTVPHDSWDADPPDPVTPRQATHRQGGPRPDAELVAASRQPLLTLDHLHHLLAGDYENCQSDSSLFSEFGAEDLVHADFSHTVPSAMDVLGEFEEQGLVSSKMKLMRHAPPTPVAKSRAQFKTDAKTLGQSLAIEVVGLMLEQLANDERLLLPVRQIVANAEPAFLQLALTDPRFFSEKSHPGRRLLDTITSASLGYASESAPGFSEFLAHLQKTAAMLTIRHANDSDHFATLLADFEQREHLNTPENRKAQRLAVQSLIQAEKRNAMAVKIASEIRARPDFVDGNRVITAFLTGPWAQVMARERLSEQGVTLGDSLSVFSLALGDLLWSLDADKVAAHRHQLVKMIPGLLQSLRQGLASIDFPIEQSQSFFDQLMALHQGLLKVWKATASSKPDGGLSIEKLPAASTQPGARDLWLAPSEVMHSGFMQDPDESSAQMATENLHQASDTGTQRPPGQAESNVALDFKLGDWVDLLVEMQWLRAQLTWVSSENSLFMFTSQGGRKHSMTSRMLRNLANLDLVKVVSRQGVLDGALDGVAATALQNSMLDKPHS